MKGSPQDGGAQQVLTLLPNLASQIDSEIRFLAQKAPVREGNSSAHPDRNHQRHVPILSL